MTDAYNFFIYSIKSIIIDACIFLWFIVYTVYTSVC